MANSYVTYTADGATDTFNVSFLYINKDHVHAYVNGVEDTSITWPTTATIQLSATPSNGDIVTLRRETPRDSRLVNFQPGNTVSDDNLDTDSEQNFYAMQEILDSLSDLIQYSAVIPGFDADSNRIANVADPTEAQDAVTKNYLDTTWLNAILAAQAAAELAETNAETAEVGAEAAQVAAETAQTAAELAETNAETAQAAAETARDKAQDWAEEVEDTEVEAGKYSALHWAAKAAASAAQSIVTNVLHEFTKAQYFAEKTLSISSGFINTDFQTDQVSTVVLDQDATISCPSNLDVGATMLMRIRQDASGGHTLSYTSNFSFGYDGVPDMPSEGSGEMILMFYATGTLTLRAQLFWRSE